MFATALVAMKTSNRVLIVDDHPLTREGLDLAARAAITGASTHGVGTVAEGVLLIERWRSCRMVLLDFMLPDAHGFSGFLRLQCAAPTTPIVVVSAREERSLVEAAKALGAAGFIFKTHPLDDIARDLRKVDAGIPVYPDDAVAEPQILAARKKISELSPAQNIVLMALADGRSNKQIGFELGVSEATVKAHLTAIFRKLGVTNRAQALLATQPLFKSNG